MTGTQNYLVRHGFSECDVWRAALGNSAALLACADAGECLDAPEWLPAGGMQSCGQYAPRGIVTSRHDAR